MPSSVTAVTLPVQWTMPAWGLSFNTGVKDANGCAYFITDEKGWSDGPPPRPISTGKPYSQGAFNGPDFYGARVITLYGHVAAPTTLARRAAEHTLSSAFSDPLNLSELHCVEETGELLANVRLDQNVTITRNPGGLDFDWSIQLAAPDPRKYSASLKSSVTNLPMSTGGLDWITGGGLQWTTGGGLNWGTVTSNGIVTMTNAGTADSWPKFIIAANGNALVSPGITILVNGSMLFYNNTMGAGDVLTINTNPATRSVLLNGITDHRRFLTTAQWASIPANSTITAAFSSAVYTTTATLTAQWSDTYW